MPDVFASSFVATVGILVRAGLEPDVAAWLASASMVLVLCFFFCLCWSLTRRPLNRRIREARAQLRALKSHASKGGRGS